MTDEDISRMRNQEFNKLLKSTKDIAEYHRIRNLYNASNNYLKKSGMLAMGRVIFVIGVVLLPILVAAGLPFQQDFGIGVWSCCFCLIGLGTTMVMLGALEQRLIDILIEIKNRPN